MKIVANIFGTVIPLLLLLLILRWPSLVAFSVQHDLHDYAKTIRASDRNLEEKERLLDMIDSVETRLNNGATLSLWEWRVHNQSIHAMLEDGITADEVRLIERELQKVKAELVQ